MVEQVGSEQADVFVRHRGRHVIAAVSEQIPVFSDADRAGRLQFLQQCLERRVAAVARKQGFEGGRRTALRQRTRAAAAIAVLRVLVPCRQQARRIVGLRGNRERRHLEPLALARDFLAAEPGQDRGARDVRRPPADAELRGRHLDVHELGKIAEFAPGDAALEQQRYDGPEQQTAGGVDGGLHRFCHSWEY